MKSRGKRGDKKAKEVSKGSKRREKKDKARIMAPTLVVKILGLLIQL